ncbi:streptavidin-V2-like [Saccostrea echinata]|uniref:streptavidin-V2-like n=1 Tax=Saccostrea echinata TaxID=191078 RepID=UPI002A82A8D8|nr:streptavidin-V2-like [Saccostrea echinata]
MGSRSSTFEAQERNDNQCPFSEKWKNELGSILSITCKGESIVGKYNRAVGKAEHDYHLAGKYELLKGDDCMLGWSVAWKNQYKDAKSVTSWTGVYYKKDDKIKTQWVLGAYKEPNDYWNTFNTNQDVFSRVK